MHLWNEGCHPDYALYSMHSFIIDKILDPAGFRHARTYGTSAAAKSCTSVYARLPDVMIRAAPPNLFVTAKSNVRWRQVTMQRLIPFACRHGLACCKVVKPGQNLSPRAGKGRELIAVSQRYIRSPRFAYFVYITIDLISGNSSARSSSSSLTLSLCNRTSIVTRTSPLSSFSISTPEINIFFSSSLVRIFGMTV